MKTTKMSLANIQGKLSRAEMKKIMAGSGGDGGCDQATCSAQSNSNLGDCNCNSHGVCLCVKIWS